MKIRFGLRVALFVCMTCTASAWGRGAESAGPTAKADNSAIFYSPYNWNITSLNATTINAGAYFRTLFTGSTITLNFDVSLMGKPASQIWWRVDTAQWTKADVAATVPLTIPAETLNSPNIPYHLVEVLVKSTSEGINRWDASATGTTVKFTGLSLESGANVKAPGAASCNLLIYGDSITEGVRTAGDSKIDVEVIDAQQGWSYQLGKLLGCEVGIVGFGRGGYTVIGSGGVPPLPESYNFDYDGAPRSFQPAPTLVINNHGCNDGNANKSSSDVQTAAIAVVKGLLAATPSSTKIVLLAPLPADGARKGAYHPANIFAGLQGAVKSVASPRVLYVGTTGVFSCDFGCDASQLHPSGPNDQGIIAPRIAALLRPYLPTRPFP